MSNKPTYEEIKKIMEEKFREVSESLGSIIENETSLNSKLEEIEERTKIIEEKTPSNSGDDFSEYNKILEDLVSLYQDYDFLLTPISDAFHFLINVSTMLEGTEPRSDVEIAEYVQKTYGNRCIHYVKSAIKASESTSRITLTRSLKRIKKILSSDEFVNESVDDIEEEEEE